MADITRAFHHPALRDESIEIHRNMFNTVRKWVEEQPDAGNLNNILSSASVKAGRNHKLSNEKGTRDLDHSHSHGALGGHGKTSGSIWSEIQSRDLGAMEGRDGNPATSYIHGGLSQPGSPGLPPVSPNFGYQKPDYQRPTSSTGGYLNPNPQPQGFYNAPPQGNYGGPSYQQGPPPFGGPGGPDWNQQPPYSGYQQQQQFNPAPYPPGPGGPGYYPGPGQQGPPYGQQQQPYGGNYPGSGGGYQGQGYGGGY